MLQRKKGFFNDLVTSVMSQNEETLVVTEGIITIARANLSPRVKTRLFRACFQPEITSCPAFRFGIVRYRCDFSRVISSLLKVPRQLNCFVLLLPQVQASIEMTRLLV